MVDEGEEDIGSEERRLFEEYRASGDVSLRDRIFADNQWVVESVVRRTQGGAEREDLLQVGYIGLLNAIERFDISRGFKFSTYATHCVDGLMYAMSCGFKPESRSATSSPSETVDLPADDLSPATSSLSELAATAANRLCNICIEAATRSEVSRGA